MKPQTIVLALAITLLVIGALGYAFLSPRPGAIIPVEIDTFTLCREAGNPIMESYPRQCKMPDGEVFTEVVDIPLTPPTPIVTEAPDPSRATGTEEMIRVETPAPSEVIASPLRVSGEARGTWYFEASFPVTIEDANGATVAVGHAEANGEWMTENFVPFTALMSWDASATAHTLSGDAGTLILKRDNPSGLPEFDAEIRVPIMF